jgi:hypothetical protein
LPSPADAPWHRHQRTACAAFDDACKNPLDSRGVSDQDDRAARSRGLLIDGDGPRVALRQRDRRDGLVFGRIFKRSCCRKTVEFDHGESTNRWLAFDRDDLPAANDIFSAEVCD